MTNSQRQNGLDRITVLANRNSELEMLINRYEPSTIMEDILRDIIAENEKTIQDLIKATDKRYEFLFNFTSGGWNSEYAYTIEEAKELAAAKYSTEDYKGNCIPDMKSFRVSTPADHANLMSMFY